MRRGWLVRVAAGCLLTAAPVVSVAACSGGGEQALRDTDKVTLCHATSSAKNLYVQQQPNVDGVLSGHDDHPDDIIPPFSYIDHDGKRQQYPGKNWDAQGEAISKAGCGQPKGDNTASQQAQGTPTTAPTTSPSTSVTPTSATPASVTTTSELPTATTAIVSGGSSTTTTEGGATPPSTTTGASNAGNTATPDTGVVPVSPLSPTSPDAGSTTTGNPSPSGGSVSPAAAPTTEAGQGEGGSPGQPTAGASGDQQAAAAQPTPAPAETGQPSHAASSSTPAGVAAAAPSSTAPQLAHTGFPTGWATALGVLLLAAGVGVLLVARRTPARLADSVPPS